MALTQELNYRRVDGSSRVVNLNRIREAPMKHVALRLGIAAAVVTVSVASGAVFSQSPHDHGAGEAVPMTAQSTPDHGQAPDTVSHRGHAVSGVEGQETAPTIPSLSGQDAFGAIQEIVRILEADPKTDWSKVDLESLRQHLIDMNEVTLKADAVAKSTDGGLEIAVTGADSTLPAIRRMLPAHAREIDGLNGWSAKTESLPNGVLLTVTSNDPKEIAHIRGLGFIGLLVSGAHHQPHHLAMAKGEFTHSH
jgi:hypothetical protein